VKDEPDNGTQRYEARPYFLGDDDAEVDAFDQMLYRIDTDWRRHVENWRTS
jgi:hypothetical protein